MQYFKLNGLTGFLLAVVLLLSILVFLVMNAIATQKATANVPYTIEKQTEIKMKSVDNVQHKIIQTKE